MKEQIIKDFVDIMTQERKQAKGIAEDKEAALDVRLQWDCRFDALNDIIEGDEFQALKSLLEPKEEKPLVVTDEMVNVAMKIVLFEQTHSNRDLYRGRVKAALEVVFSSQGLLDNSGYWKVGESIDDYAKRTMASSENTQCKCLEPNPGWGGLEGKCSHCHYTLRKNAQPDDGWIKHHGNVKPVLLDNNDVIDVRYLGAYPNVGSRNTAHSYDWENITAYRIVKDPKENPEEKCKCGFILTMPESIASGVCVHCRRQEKPQEKTSYSMDKDNDCFRCKGESKQGNKLLGWDRGGKWCCISCGRIIGCCEKEEPEPKKQFISDSEQAALEIRENPIENIMSFNKTKGELIINVKYFSEYLEQI